jgi:hypothetical protein
MPSASFGWFSYSPAAVPEVDGEDRFELADVGRYGRSLVRRFVTQARAAERPTLRSIVSDHLGVPVDDLPVVEESWPAYEHVNVQVALDRWLDDPDRTHELVGLTGYRHRGPFGLSDLLNADPFDFHGVRPGNVTRISLPSGPAGATRECLRAAVVLVTAGEERLALLVRGADPESGHEGVALEVVAGTQGTARRAADELRELALELNVYRGQVVSFGRSMFGERGSLLRFHERPRLAPSSLVLPETTFADLRRQVVGVARNSDRLKAAGQHLKRGLLLYGPPGVGKTHTVRYLMGELVGTTIVQLTGETLGGIRDACSIARALQPAMIVVEDVDLIAAERDGYGGEGALLFTLLNEMDGLDEDADVVFLLTTNRADLLEPALASRPGRVDQAVHIDLPDREARRRLVDLYRGRLDVDLSGLEDVLDRTDGVTASFLKELLRRAAVIAADQDDRQDGDDRKIRVSATDLDAALSDLLDTRNQMTRAVLGYGERGAAG